MFVDSPGRPALPTEKERGVRAEGIWGRETGRRGEGKE